MGKSNMMKLAHIKAKRLMLQGCGNYRIALSIVLKRLHEVNNMKCNNSY